MNTASIIYLASVAGNVATVILMASVVGTLVNGFSSIPEWNSYEGVRWKIRVPLQLIFFMLAFSAALIPDEENIYKIAGVTGQQKAIIDATGAVIADQANSSPAGGPR